jgi:hypothetical protein
MTSRSDLRGQTSLFMSPRLLTPGKLVWAACKPASQFQQRREYLLVTSLCVWTALPFSILHPHRSCSTRDCIPFSRPGLFPFPCNKRRPDSNWLFSAGADGTIKQWDMDSMMCKNTLRVSSFPPFTLASKFGSFLCIYQLVVGFLGRLLGSEAGGIKAPPGTEHSDCLLRFLRWVFEPTEVFDTER